MKAILAAAALMLAAAPAVAQDATADITFTFQVGHPTGQIMIALYDNEAAFDDGGAPVRRAAVPISADTAQVVFEDLPAGDYAAKLFHDLDGDNEMDTNPFGLPAEPYAFSNNARGNMGPARWDRAHFTVAGDVAQTLDLDR